MITTEFSFVLAPSPIAGIGVFATHDIPVNTVLLTGNFSFRKMKIKDIPPDFIKYCIYIDDEECKCPERFDRMEIGWYINHSNQPNIGKDAQRNLITIRAIKAHEEILLDYNDLNEPNHLKEAYYKRVNY